MRKFLLPWTVGLAGAISLVFSSCAYDPYYSSAGGYYDDGYGYGSSSFSTSLFVSTGDPRWGYDPYTYCYYDYRSRRYYDPYLYGYYPVGYRPYAVYGVPHPHGWRSGHGHCPPPRTVRDVTVVNYRNREAAYRSSNYSWAKQVKQRPSGSSYRPPSSGSRTYSPGTYSGTRSDYRTHSSNYRDSRKPEFRSPQESRYPQVTPYSRGGNDRSKRDDHRSTGRFPSPQQAVRSDYSQSSRQYRPDRSSDQSMQHAQPPRQSDRPQEYRSHRSDPPRQQAQPSYQSKQNDDSQKIKRRSLRSLGDG